MVQVSTHFIPNTAGLNLHSKHLDLAHLPPVGRLKHCLVKWQVIYNDPLILQAIEGYHIDFKSPSYQTRHPHGITHTQAESNLIENEVQDLLTNRPSTESQWGRTRLVCQL